ncbi:MAG: cytochrome c oxidase subunit I [Acidimicrobiia bacterium]|nr:cytochrome c oxidase subunit I [Acidimicrobiia bacterium]
MYGITALVFFVIGGLEALLLRLQLASPNAEVLSADAYNQLFTMHGLTMVFMVVMPIAAAFSDYFLPIMLGARDVAFPRLNALSYWVFVGAGLFMYSSFILGGAPDGAWVGYAPLSTQLPETVRMDFFALGIQVAGIASIASSANFIATVFTMRAPGMTLMRMPVFAWMTLIVAFLLIFSLPIVGVGLWQMFFDRNFGSTFYLAAAGGDPLLWQHLFWLFGHPEVYVLILPAMGIVSEVLPTFSRKPLFGYAFVVFAGIAIAFLGFGVWSHHMFTAGMGPLAEAGFALSTMFIAVPTGIKIFNWIGTTWGGSLRFNTPMLFSLGFVAMFVIGGLSGVTHSIAPSDTQQHDSYYVVAHFHYVLFGGAIFGYMAGVYYWFPKWTGRMLNETVGKWHFWLMMLGFNLTFAPMHLLGLNGMPRRIYTYPEGLGFEFWNFIATLGAFTIAVSVLVFIVNLIWSKRKGDVAGPDPWDGRTLEWSIPSPPPEHNFDEVPVVRSVDDFWHRKYTEDEEGRLVPMPAVSGGALAVDETTTGGDDDGHGEIHMPSPSYYPALTAVGMTVSAFGLTYTPWGWIAVGVGAVTMLLGLFGWAVEPVTKEDQ